MNKALHSRSRPRGGYPHPPTAPEWTVGTLAPLERPSKRQRTLNALTYGWILALVAAGAVLGDR